MSKNMHARTEVSPFPICRDVVTAEEMKWDTVFFEELDKITCKPCREKASQEIEKRANVWFTPIQVAALCGGKLPPAGGFHWAAVNHFRLEDGVLQPYRGKEILPGPGIAIEVRQISL